jgi:hypothetical protein
MKTSFEVIKKPYISQKVVFSAEENKVLAKPAVKSATKAALSMWHSVQRTNEEFGVQIKKVHDEMIKHGTSCHSLFSKWCLSVGIPRSTAYWKMATKKQREDWRKKRGKMLSPDAAISPEVALEGLKLTFGKYADPHKVFFFMCKLWSYCCAGAGLLTIPEIPA